MRGGRIMRKKIAVISMVTIVTFGISACSSGSATAEFMDKLEEHAKHNTSYVKEEQTTVYISIEPSVEDNERETIVKVKSDTNIMNKPSIDGTIVGEVKSNESVLIIGEKNTGGWYKVAYNGRVCYVKGTSLNMNEFVVDNGNDDRPTSTVEQQSSETTEDSSEQQTTSSDSSEITSSEVTSDEETTLDDETTSEEEQSSTESSETETTLSESEGPSETETTLSESEGPSETETTSSETDNTSETETIPFESEETTSLDIPIEE